MIPLLDSILLIDDDHATNFFHEYVIKQLHCAKFVVAKQSGAEALDYLRNDKLQWPDLILLDINMPRMNGWEFLDAYRRIHHDRKYRTTMVMLTVSENPDDRSRAQGYKEVNEFVIKPLTDDKLRALLRKYFEQKI